MVLRCVCTGVEGPPPQPTFPTRTIPSSSVSIASGRRLRDGMQNVTRPANADPPAMFHRFRPDGDVPAVVVFGAVVRMVRVE